MNTFPFSDKCRKLTAFLVLENFLYSPPVLKRAVHSVQCTVEQQRWYRLDLSDRGRTRPDRAVIGVPTSPLSPALDVHKLLFLFLWRTQYQITRYRSLPPNDHLLYSARSSLCALCVQLILQRVPEGMDHHMSIVRHRPAIPLVVAACLRAIPFRSPELRPTRLPQLPPFITAKHDMLGNLTSTLQGGSAKYLGLGVNEIENLKQLAETAGCGAPSLSVIIGETLYLSWSRSVSSEETVYLAPSINVSIEETLYLQPSMIVSIEENVYLASIISVSIEEALYQEPSRSLNIEETLYLALTISVGIEETLYNRV
ncbi:hypothetical protein J6590_034196 [Homalodisca vitripennis]|nr:hypothetical protein J6590_034196 [Homalodisca vitripennis]